LRQEFLRPSLLFGGVAVAAAAAAAAIMAAAQGNERAASYVPPRHGQQRWTEIRSTMIQSHYLFPHRLPK